MKGCFLKLLKINVTKKTFRVEDIDKDIIEANIGGEGLGTKLLLDNNPPGVDPLGPDNHLVIASGPLSGSSLYGSSRYGIFAKSPLTHGYGESYSGGSFAGPLSNTGFDAVVIKGISENPIWIEINPYKVVFHDAGQIWGKDTFKTEDYLKKESKGKQHGIMVIGPAGENLVRFAIIKNDKHRVAGRTGMGAVLGCGKNVEVQQGRHKGLKLEGPEYETIYAFGGLCMIDEIEEISYLNRLCDSLGVDTISSGNLVAFAIDASKKGKINEKIEYGSADDVSKLIQKIVKRQGVGGIIAEGIKHAAKELDMQDWAVHVKGMEPAGYDPRILKGMGLAYAVSERGACHLRTTFYKAELSGMIDPDAIDNKVEMFIDFEDRCTLFDSFILCRFFRDLYPWEDLSKLLFLTTGISYDQSRLSLIAAGIKDNTRRFNLQEGLTSADDTLPPRLFDHKLEKDKGISKGELGKLVSDYYKIRGWDAKGIPEDNTTKP